MHSLSLCLSALLLLLLTAPAAADEPLQSVLHLSMEQAREVSDIQARSRRAFASTRQAFNRESRAMRRARLANDAQELVRLETVTEGLREELRRIQQSEDDQVRALLNERQQLAFDAFLVERRQMHGSSRDERLFD
jgi:hypothetical protein